MPRLPVRPHSAGTTTRILGRSSKGARHDRASRRAVSGEANDLGIATNEVDPSARRVELRWCLRRLSFVRISARKRTKPSFARNFTRKGHIKRFRMRQVVVCTQICGLTAIAHNALLERRSARKTATREAKYE